MILKIATVMLIAMLAMGLPLKTEAYFNQTLQEGQKISNGQYLMVPDTSSPTLVPPWLAMQRDCNLVLYDQVGQPVWSTGTYDQGIAGSCYAMVETCNLFIYSGKNSYYLWNSSTPDASQWKLPCFATILLEKNANHTPSVVLYDSLNNLAWSSQSQ